MTNVKEGALLLEDGHGKVLRVSIGEPLDEKLSRPPQEPAIAVPTGSYRLVGYRLYQRDARGDRWIVSVGGLTKRHVKIQEGVATSVDVEPAVLMTSRLAANGQVQMMVSAPDDPRAGATLYKNGKRIPMRFRILGPEPVREGSITYG